MKVKNFLSDLSLSINALRYRAEILNDALSFIGSGIYSYNRQAPKEMIDLEHTVKTKISDAFTMSFVKKVDNSSEDSEAWEIFFYELNKANESIRTWKHVLPNMRLITPEIEKLCAIGAVNDGWEQRIEYDTEAYPSVSGAYRMAVNNLMQTETRLVVLRTIGTLANITDSNSLWYIHNELQKQRTKYLSHIGLFGLLSIEAHEQGEAREILSRHYLVSRSPNIKMSVIEYLHADGTIPGASPTGPVDTFRADIMTCLKTHNIT